MCGIAGFIGNMGNKSAFAQDIRRMTDAIAHRGPDDRGAWMDISAGIALGHRRLSVIDLSPAGSQPMVSSSGRYVVAFNGEVYNYLAIRKELESAGCISIQWRGYSDTEVVLAAIEAWGLERAVKSFVGMFAFALWDRQDRVMRLVRDRLGEKPLYYGWAGDVFLFSSETKALKAHPAFHATIDRNILTLLLRYNCIPAPYCIYQGFYKLLPGTILTLSGDKMMSRDGYDIETYWSAREIAEQGLTTPFSGSEEEAGQYLDCLLNTVVADQMIADVPLGAFLSGGVDSSTIVAVMQRQSNYPIKTFTIGFSEANYNEASDAKAVARYLGTEHTEFYISSSDALAVIPRLANIYDEPFSDSSQIPTFLVSQMTRQHVTVSLSGDGGDELFGGYNRYSWCECIWKKISWMPLKMRGLFSMMLHQLSPQSWDRAFNVLSPLLPRRFMQRTPGLKLHKLSEVLKARSPMEMYELLSSHWKEPGLIVRSGVEPVTVLTNAGKRLRTDNIAEQMMFLDLITFLPDDILVKLDRAAMAVSLETRVPFLDHRIVEFAWKLPLPMKVRSGRGKWLLRQVLNKYMPEELIDRPKMGFGIPLDMWLRGPLRDWAESLLNETRLRNEGFFNVKPVIEKWQEHISGRRSWQFHLWDVLMFQAWLDSSRSS